MAIKVKAQLIKTEEGAEVTYKYEGRLLGLASEMEGTKIALNPGVSSRVFTQETKRLVDVNDAIDKSVCEDIKDLPGHIVMTVDKMVKGKDSKLLSTLSKQLFLTPPIVMVSETGKDTKTDLMSSTIDCGDGSIFTIEEINNE